jgi:hypothetical protein
VVVVGEAHGVLTIIQASVELEILPLLAQVRAIQAAMVPLARYFLVVVAEPVQLVTMVIGLDLHLDLQAVAELRQPIP